MQPDADSAPPISRLIGGDMPKGLPHHPPVAGIVAEYNPFHKGHEWMIAQLRKGGVHTVVCVLSGPFVQRAEPALLPTYLRARAALSGGADLVLRLPLPWALASAEGFAQGGVGVLAALGCVDVLAFGTEGADAETLAGVAACLLGDSFPPVLRQELGKGVSFAAARAAAAALLLPGAGKLLSSPNNILGIEYLKALKSAIPTALRAKMREDVQWRVISELYGRTANMDDLFMLPEALALPRVGPAHGGQPQSGFASAAWLRAAAEKSGVGVWGNWVPSACMPLYRAAQEEGNLIDYSRYEVALLSRLKAMRVSDIARAPGAGEGLENRLAEAAKRATGLAGLYDDAKTKRFAHSRVRRLALAAALELPPHSPAIPPFAHVLAANARGLSLLKRAKKNALIPVSSSLAKLAASGEEARSLIQLEASAEDLHAAWLHTPAPGGGAFTRPATLLLGAQGGVSP